jgi:serpin B
MRVSMPVFALSLLSGWVFACSESPSDEPPGEPRLVTRETRDIAAAVDGHNRFSWEMYGALLPKAGTDNVFFSPFSITSALGMTLAGANGTTEAEMKAVLHASDDEAAWHTALGALTQDLNGDLDRGYTLYLANRLFGQTAYPWEEPFLATCADAYGAPLEPWDFRADPEGGRARVNQWVQDQTAGRIVDLLPAGSVTSDTRLVLANAIYFIADWETAFDPDDTQDASFLTLDGPTVTVPMMYMDIENLEEHGIETGWSDGVSLIKMPYVGKEVSMVLAIPDDAAGLPAVESGLTAATYQTWLDTLGPAYVPIGMPRLEIRYAEELSEPLTALGMGSAFTAEADFTGMAVPPDGAHLSVSGVFHQAFVKVDEKGTEAAAATGVVVGEDSAPMPIIADRPFLMIIQDDLTGAILFVGRVTDPRG